LHTADKRFVPLFTPDFCSILYPGFYPFSINTKQHYANKSRLHIMDGPHPYFRRTFKQADFIGTFAWTGLLKTGCSCFVLLQKGISCGTLGSNPMFLKFKCFSGHIPKPSRESKMEENRKSGTVSYFDSIILKILTHHKM